MAMAFLAIATVTALWAATFTAGKYATGPEGFHPLLVAGVRIVATAAVFYVLLPGPRRRKGWAQARSLLPLALTGIVINQLGFCLGISLTSPSHSAFIYALIPVFVALAAWRMLGERVPGTAAAGMALAVGGALTVIIATVKSGSRSAMLGDLFTTVSMLGFALYTVLGRRTVGRMGSFDAVTFAFVLAAPFMLPFLAYGAWRQNWSCVTWRGAASLAFLVVGSTLICYSLHLFALSRLRAAQVAIFTNLQPVLGTAIAVAAGLDHLTRPLIVGGALALGGVVLVQIRRSP